MHCKYHLSRLLWQPLSFDTLCTLRSKHSAVPISFLQSNSPHIQTIHQENYTVIDHYNAVYPPFQAFIGARLDQDQTPIGLISIMDDKPLTPAQLDCIQQILLAVKTRVRNEIERTRQREQLVMVKNAAIKDAQGKIKFLADMSHEIRYSSKISA